MTNIATINDFTKNAVENFVQTVVFVDDKIYASSSKSTVVEPKIVSPPKARKPATKGAAEIPVETPTTASKALVNEITYSPHDIQSSFAKKRIVCSLHQPIKANSVGMESDTYKLCASADIVIVDWDLYGDAGEKATLLIENLILQSLKDNPHQLRLVLIYTDDPNLFAVADKVSERLSKQLPDGIEDKDSDHGLAFHTSNSRVVVLGKPAERLDEFKPFEVSEAELANRAINEFCKLADGMLQGGILMGLATIRKQSRKILTKFHSGLDAAFLTHRALLQPHEEAFDHIVSLLVSEIQAILEDNLESPLFPETVVQDWCNKAKFGTCAQSSVQGADFKAFAYDFCRFGSDARGKYSLSTAPTNKQLQTLLLPDKEKTKSPQPDMSSMEQLAALMSHRTHYDNQRRFLRLGTILRECSEKPRFLLCLQPACDSTRLIGSNPFLFCYMDEPKNNKVTHIVPDGNNFCELLLNPCKENRTIINFSANHKKRVTAKKGASSEYLFSDDKNNEYQWIAQLKVEHAQRAAEQFARELSRVGLTESEWLRLKA
jgi:hypothetical protein